MPRITALMSVRVLSQLGVIQIVVQASKGVAGGLLTYLALEPSTPLLAVSDNSNTQAPQHIYM